MGRERWGVIDSSVTLFPTPNTYTCFGRGSSILHKHGLVGRGTCIIQALGKWRQEDQKLKTSLGPHSKFEVSVGPRSWNELWATTTPPTGQVRKCQADVKSKASLA